MPPPSSEIAWRAAQYDLGQSLGGLVYPQPLGVEWSSCGSN